MCWHSQNCAAWTTDWFMEVRHDRAAHVLHITMRCGDIPMGYYDLALTYVDAEISLQRRELAGANS